ncbi:MAG TPA: V-type ATPase subunit [Kofleriaceae bacterium]|nr:V-type ATPase subunit [Kofleriaceae bacterium]
MTRLASRARGLETHVLDAGALAELERAPDRAALAAVMTRTGLACDVSTAAIDRAARDRAAADFRQLERWLASRRDHATFELLVLDEDRRSLRAIVRGIAGAIEPERRRAACVPTPWLRDRVLGELAAAATLGELHAALVELGHPLAPALAGDHPDPLVHEQALFAAVLDRAKAGPADRALARYLSQLVDGELVAAALLLASRGGGLDPAASFVAGGTLDRARFLAAAAGPIQRARELLAAHFARTPLAAALEASTGAPAAIEQALLDWQLATQARLRRDDPHGTAAVIHLVLERRVESRTLRRAAWRIAFGDRA